MKTMTERIDFLTPVGRIVQGDCFQAETKDADGKPLTVRSGPNAGQPRVNYYIALAIPKTDPGWPELCGKIHRGGQEGFPQFFDPAGNCTLPTFAIKYEDGDSQVPNTKGRKPCEREGYPGHWVVRLSSGFAPQIFTQGGKEVIVDSAAIKRGDFVRCYGSVTGNGSTQRPGVFVNLSMVELIGYGFEIKTGPDGAAVFGGAPVAQMPVGCSATPVASGAPIAQGAPPTPGGFGHPAHGQPTIGTMSANPPTPGDFQATPPLAAGAPPPPFADGPPAPRTYTLSDGKQYTREQLVASGWTDAMIAALP